MTRSWLTQPIDLAGVLGLFSCLLAVQNATVRVIFSMARDRVLPGVARQGAQPLQVAVHVDLRAASDSRSSSGILLSVWLGSGLTDVYG